jgi:membrane-bound lytic murein transglycosylase D
MAHRRHATAFAMLAVIIAGCAHPGTRIQSPAPVSGSAAAVRTTPTATPVEGDTKYLVPPSAVRDSINERLQVAVSTLALFGDSTVIALVDSTEGDAVVPTTEPADATWDIDVNSYVTHDRVDYYVRLFSGRAKDRFAAWLQRGRRYEPMIRATFRARGIPEDMYYLGVVESGYDPHALSSAYAVGMWQFMTATARGFGMRVDWWVDERRDPIKATYNAARFISDLKDQFGSFYLAAAAYNGGPGRVARGLRRYADDLEETSGEDCYFALVETGYLRSETQNYVPQLIAAALIGKEPKRYGIVLDSVPPYAYDSVYVPAATSIPAVARAVGSTTGALRELNPFILRGMTPPDAALWVRLPVGRGAGAADAVRAMSDEDRRAFRVVKTRKSQSLASIAAANGLSLRQLQSYNPTLPKTKSGRLSAGVAVRLPTTEVADAAFNVPDPKIERYGRASGARTHVVRRGETLGGIAKKNGTSVAALMRLNRFKKPVIYPGQTILVRGSRAGASRSRSSGGSRSSASRSRSSAKSRGVAKSPRGTKTVGASGATAQKKSAAASTNGAAARKR